MRSLDSFASLLPFVLVFVWFREKEMDIDNVELGTAPITASSTMMQEVMSVLTNPYIIVAFAAAVLVAVLFIIRYLRGKYRKVLVAMKPMERFLFELTQAASPGHDKALFQMIPHEVMQSVEKGTIRAMGRCIVKEIGAFVGLDTSTFTLKRQKGPTRTVLVGTAEAKFASSCCPIQCSVTWFKHPKTKAPQILGFQVTPGHGKGPLNVTGHVEPNDFESFGERFVVSLMKKEPAEAHEMMFAGLQKKYPDPALLAVEVAKVLRTAGGFKGSVPEVTFTNGDRYMVNEANKTQGLRLEYHVAGRLRDLTAEVRVAFIGLKCQVVRYELRASPLKEKQVAYDPETGEKTVLAE